MKTLRLTMIATLLAFALASWAGEGGFAIKPDKKIVNVTLGEAIRIPGLVIAMYQQLDKEMLNQNLQTYSVKVVFNGNIFRITGSYEEWTLFFRLKWKFSSAVKHDVTDG